MGGLCDRGPILCFSQGTDKQGNGEDARLSFLFLFDYEESYMHWMRRVMELGDQDCLAFTILFKVVENVG